MLSYSSHHALGDVNRKQCCHGVCESAVFVCMDSKCLTDWLLAEGVSLCVSVCSICLLVSCGFMDIRGNAVSDVGWAGTGRDGTGPAPDPVSSKFTLNHKTQT